MENLDFFDFDEIVSNELLLAALYHDVGKPLVAFEKMAVQFFIIIQRTTKSREIAEQELSKHNLGQCLLGRILFYIEHHDDFISFKLKNTIKGEQKQSFCFADYY